MSDSFLKVKSSTIIRENNIKTGAINNENETATNDSVLIIHQTPRASVLKIDSFVPNLKLQRLKKNSSKNLSLLSSSTYIRRLNATTRNLMIDKNTRKYYYKNGILGLNNNNNNNKSCDKINNNIYDYARLQKSNTSRIKTTITSIGQRFNNSSIIKSSSSSSNHQKNAINLPLEYSLITNFGGICKILRTQKEKEKLPDRINCDKRGLTSIPLFLNESNLRLLSLQHNLINVFHVPSDQNIQNIKNATECELQQKHENKSDIIDLPIVTKINKHNINFDKNDLKIDTTITQNGFSKRKQQNKVISNDEIEIVKDSFDNNNISRMTITNGSLYHNNNNNNTTSASTLLNNNTKKYEQNSKFNNYSGVKNTNTNKNIKIKNLISPHSTKQFKILKSELKNNKNIIDTTTTTATTNLSSFDGNETTFLGATTTTATAATTQDLKMKLNENSNSNMENIFMDKILLNSSYADIYQNLIFLDLYNNQIEKILNLDGFKSLTVLLLGKNRITDITGISSLKKTLRVLDLHGNRITNISNKINDLYELKSLNLAGNQIEQIYQNDFAGLINLKELNLKRNKIKRVHGFDHLLNLERLWLCHNDLQKIDDMLSVAKATNLQEVTVENNPVSMVGDCVSFLVSYLPNLKVLSQMPVTDQVRKAALVWRKNKEISERNNSLHLSTNLYNNIRREEIISNARTNWELLRSQRTPSAASQKFKTKTNKKSIQSINTTVEDYIESGMKQFHTTTNFNNNNDIGMKTPIINSETKSLVKSRGLENYILKEGNNNDCGELQLPPIASEPIFPATNDREHQSKITKSISNSSLSPNLHSSSSGLGSDSDENSKVIKTEKFEQIAPLLLSSSAPSLSQSSSSSSISTTSSPEIKCDENQILNSKSPQFPNLEESNNLKEDNMWNKPAQNDSVANIKNFIEKSNLSEQLIDITEKSNLKENENITNNRSESELHTPKSTSTITSKIVNCSTKGDCSSSSNSVLTISCGSNNFGNLPTNVNLLEKLQLKQTESATTAAVSSCNVNNVKKCNKNSFFRSQTARVNKNINNNNNSNIFNVNYQHNNDPPNGDKLNSNNNSAVITINKQVVEREREQGGDYLIEICGKYLNIYGVGALRFIDKQWNQTKACDVNTLNFSYINFNNIAFLLNRIKQRFPNAEKYIFRETNLQYLGQLNALADLQGIHSLSIEPEGNHIINNALLKSYAIYRLNHWGLRILNNIEITHSEIDNAHKDFRILSDIVLWVIPENMLQPIIHKLHFDEKYTMSSLYPKEWLLKTDKTVKEIVGKEALQWKKYNLQLMQSEERCFRERAKTHFGVMIDNLCNAAEKLQIFDIIWPKILLDMITNSLLDYSQMEVYLKKF